MHYCSHADGMKHQANIKQHSEIQNFICRGRKESGSNIKSLEENSVKGSGEASVRSTSKKFLTQKRVVAKHPTPELMQSTGDKCMKRGDALKAENIWTLFCFQRVFK